MLRWNLFLATCLAISSMLTAGCGSLSQKNPEFAKDNSVEHLRTVEEREGQLEKVAQAHAHYAAGVIHEMRDEQEAALQEYYQAALNDTENETLILEVSRRFIQNKQVDKAIELLSHAAARPSASGAIHARLGFLYAQMGKYDEAAVANRAAISKSPGSLGGYQNLFFNYLQKKQSREALKVLDQAGKQSNAQPEFLIGLAELQVEFGAQLPAQKKMANERALSLLNRAEKLKPASPPLRLKLAEDFVAAGDSSKAAQIYLDLLKTLPDVPLVRERVHAKLTDIYLRADDKKRAQEQLEAIIHEDPTNPQAYYFLGNLAYEDKKLPQAEEYFSKTILLNKDFEQAYYELALAQLGQGKAREALNTLDQARVRFAKKFVSEFLSGLAYNRQKEYAEALRHFTEAEVIAKATETNRLDHSFYFQVGATYERKGDYEQAEKYFEKSLQISPNFAEAQNYLGYMWAEHGMKLDHARELIQKAVQAEPKNAAYLDSMGWVLFKLNQPKEALGYVLKAVELSEEPDATVYDHLGDVYLALSERDKARAAWQRSLSVETNDEVRKKLEGAGVTK